MLKRSILSLFVFLTFATQVATAQPPGIRRWTGGTANSQIQGFSQGDPLVLTWSFTPDGTAFNNGDSSNLLSFLDGIYNGGIVDYQPVFQSAIGRWAEVSGLTIEFEPNDDGVIFATFAVGDLDVRGDIRFAGRVVDGNNGVLAFATFPTAGDIVLDTGDFNFYGNLGGNSLRVRNVVAHEFGHALGFYSVAGHVVSSDSRQLLEPTIDLSFDGPQYHDILSVQRGYGDIFETGVGNDSANVATELGLLMDGESVVLGESAHRRGTSLLFTANPSGLEIQPNETDFISIDDQTDTDVYSFTVMDDGNAFIVLDTLGETYSAGGQNQNNQIDFDTSERVDLTLELLGTDGQTVLATSNSGGFGDDELLDVEIESGTYFVRITGVNNPDATTLDTQFYGLAVSFEETELLLGDINMDGGISFADIAAFISLLATGEFLLEADINQDGMVSFADIGPFVSILSGG